MTAAFERGDLVLVSHRHSGWFNERCEVVRQNGPHIVEVRRSVNRRKRGRPVSVPTRCATLLTAIDRLGELA